ncbi:hypothetical protein [Nocardia sp. NPDC052566]|uniref:hypothetical protein n=1 Tax=Nocardia sp. NPDC052566 TaxID=3364330 RepID=UPI0037CA68FA
MTTNDNVRALIAEERAELERLRAAVAVRPHRIRHTLRWTGVGIVLVLMGIALFGAVVARFCRGEILDTDRYLATVAPLSAEPAIQAELADRITTAITTRVDVARLTADALDLLVADLPQSADRPRISAALHNVPPLVATQTEALIRRTAQSFVASEQFERIWISANRHAHEILVAVLTGRSGTAVVVDDKGTVSISLQAILSEVRQRLDERGITFADRVPDLDAQFVLFQSSELVRAQHAVRVLDRLSGVLPWLALAAAATAVLLAPRGYRLRAISLAGAAAVVAMVLLAIALVIGRQVYLGEMPPEVLSPAAAAAVIDAVYRPLRAALRAVAAVGLLAVMTGYLAGQSNSARAVRESAATALAKLRGARADRPPTTIELAAARFLLPLRLAVLIAAVVALVWWRYPTGLVVLGIALAAGVALSVLQCVALPAKKASRAHRP